MILLVEDDPTIARVLAAAVRDAGFELCHVTSGAEALAADDVDLVLLDLGLPDLDGRDVLRALRRTSAVPVIILTARSEEFDRVLGLELGADDYVTKPCSAREVVARIRAVLRRTRVGPGLGPERLEAADGPDRLEPSTAEFIHPLEIDRRTRHVALDGTAVALTAKEFDVLAYLADEPGVVRSRHEIITAVWKTAWYGPTKTVDAHIASIRRKLGDPAWIEAVRSVGFRLHPPR